MNKPLTKEQELTMMMEAVWSEEEWEYQRRQDLEMNRDLEYIREQELKAQYEPKL